MEESREYLYLLRLTVEELQDKYDKSYVIYKEKADILKSAVPNYNFALIREVASDLSDFSYYLQQLQVIIEIKKRLGIVYYLVFIIKIKGQLKAGSFLFS